MKALACDLTQKGCTCWCHASDVKFQCTCYIEMKAAEARAAALAAKKRSQRDLGRDGRPLPESALENYLGLKVKQIGGKVFKIAPLVKGNPDRCVMIPYGRIYLVETKTFVGVPSPAQVVWHERARKMGQVVHVINTKAKIDGFVRWAVATGMGLKDGHTQSAKDFKAMTEGYPYREGDED